MAGKRPQRSKNPKPFNTPTSTATRQRNKFIDVVDPVMPRGLPAWVRASHRAGVNFKTQQNTPGGVDNGYSLPDPNNFVVQNEAASTAFFTMWLKLRPVILHLLQIPQLRPLRANQWRSILGAGFFSTTPKTQSDTSRRDLLNLLQTTLKEEALEAIIDLTNLESVPMNFADQCIIPPMLNEEQLRREVLWELFEINFRCELIRLDRLCYRFPSKDVVVSSPTAREIEILWLIPHFGGMLIPMGKAKEASELGFAAKSSEKRQEALWGLYCVMQGWREEFAMSEQLQGMGRWLETNSASEGMLQILEYDLAFHYISTFRNVFFRAPLLPHGL